MKSFQFYFLLKKAKNRGAVINLLRAYKNSKMMDEENEKYLPLYNLLLVYYGLI